ncbi:MAG: tetratricopeptide repeat protein [Verrucomicrobia bacterium]|nr:tetratricopeptide repeat protein [Verrucomicrobiota bacterium]
MSSPATTSFPRRAVILAAALIVLAGLAAYHNSFGGPFVFDDQLSIAFNPTIQLLGTALVPPRGGGLTVEGRPLLNFSFALSHALTGQAVAGYHAMNLAIHLGAGLALLGLVRRTVMRCGNEAIAGSATAVAFAVALLWVVHPLQTESVTYLVQRAESQMGLFFLLTLYCFARGIDCHPLDDKRPDFTSGMTEKDCHLMDDNRSGWRSVGWFGVAGVAAGLGAGTKEVTAAAPVLALLWDRTFVAGSFRAAWRARRGVYLGLFASWLVIAGLVVTTGNRGGTVGFGSNVAWSDYALTQVEAIVHYLRLAVWPSPLIFDYGVEWKASWFDVAPQGLLVVALVVGTIVAVVRRPVGGARGGAAWGFLGVWFFAMLAPTSLIPGNRQTIAEHRMYLSLAAVVVPVVLGLFWLIDGKRNAGGWPRSLVLFAAIAVGLGWATVRRNEDYRSVLALYRDTAAKRPGNAFARYNLGKVLAESGAPAEAVAEYRAAIRLKPDYAVAHYNLGNALGELGRHAEAAEAFRAALRVQADYARAHYNLGNALVQLGQKAAAAAEFAAAVRQAPAMSEARENLANVLMELGRLDEARAEFEAVVRAQPASATAHFGLGNVFFLGGRMAEAAAEYERALALDPKLAPARAQLERARGKK